MKKLFLSALAAVSILSANAQDSTATVTATPLVISGSIDAYYRANISGDQLQAPGTSFANRNGFALGMANVILEKAGEKTGFVADLVVGPRGSDAVFGATTASSSIVNQLYAYWNVSDAVTLTLGNFNTYLGYEVISPTGNFNYSTSYMFSYGPFSHSGLKADIALTDELSLALAVMNPTDFTDFNPGTTYILGGQLGYSNDNGGAWLNTRFGDEDGAFAGGRSAGQTFQIDLTTGWDLSDEFYLGFNGTYLTTGAGVDADSTGAEIDVDGDASGFMGAAVYLQYALSDAFKLGVRAEQFMVTKGGLDPTVTMIGLDEEGNGAVTALTLSANYTVGDLTLIPEFRIDLASKQYNGPGLDDTGMYMADGEDSSSLASFLLAAVYAF